LKRFPRAITVSGKFRVAAKEKKATVNAASTGKHLPLVASESKFRAKRFPTQY
jgi:hypothetical protein